MLLTVLLLTFVISLVWADVSDNIKIAYTYYPSGKLHSTLPIKGNTGEKAGTLTVYYENGNMKSEVLATGTVRQYDVNGNLQWSMNSEEMTPTGSRGVLNTSSIQVPEPPSWIWSWHQDEYEKLKAAK